MRNKKQKHESRKNKSDRKTVTGPISITAKGAGYVPFADNEDIEIPEQFLNTAFNNDKVEIALHPKKKGARQQGEVVRVIERFKNRFVGVVDKNGRAVFVLPDDNRAYRDFFIQNPPEKINTRDKVLIEFAKWDDPKRNPEAKIVSVIGKSGEHDTEMNSIVIERGFDIEFPSKIEKEAEKIKEKDPLLNEDEVKKRKDLRDIATFTIDPADAKDFDDAVSLQKTSKGIEIGIHIADVSFYVERGGILDKEARKRGTSVYLVDRTIPMLPEILSNDLCSLNPDEDKAAFSAIFTLDENAKVKESWFGRTIIKSKKRYSYTDAQNILDSKQGEFYEEMSIANDIAKKLRKERFEEGAIDFDTDEIAFELDQNGVPTRIYKKERLDVHKLIEELMLLANRKVAQYLFNKKEVGRSIYRIHEHPDPEKIENLLMFMKAFGYNLDIKPNELSPTDLNDILHKVEGKPEEQLVNTAIIRSMSKAVYSTKSQGHFGLAFKHYTHFTSPIRRYPDLIVHRLLYKKLKGKSPSKEEIASLDKIATESTEKEIRATEAERESIRQKQVEYMTQHKGEIFDAVISGITDWGIYIEEEETLSSGMVPIRTLTDDYYEFNEKEYSLVGKKNKKKYRIGDEAKVKLTDTDPDRKNLTFEFV